MNGTPLPSSPPPGKRDLPANAHRCEPVNLSLPPDDCDYLDRRALSECGGNRSALVRKMIREAKAFRHDLRGPVNAVNLLAMVMKKNAAPPGEVTELLEDVARQLRALVDSVE